MSTPIPPSFGPSGIEHVLHSGKPAASVRRTRPIDRWLVAHLQRGIPPAAIRLELWDGSSPYDDATTPLGSLVIRDRRTLIGLALDPDLHFGESYTAGRLEVRGRLAAVVEALTGLSQPHTSWRDRLRLTLPNTLSASRRNVHSHSDRGNDFYQLWLDRDLVHTCAYYANQQMSLDGCRPDVASGSAVLRGRVAGTLSSRCTHARRAAIHHGGHGASVAWLPDLHSSCGTRPVVSAPDRISLTRRPYS